MSVVLENPNPESPHRGFVDDLYRIGNSLESKNPHVVARSRRTLARLRRGLTDDRYAGDGYELLFRHQIPERHEPPCLLVAGLFALNSHTTTRASERWRLCAALADAGSAGAADARVRQLIGATQTGGLDYRLRQAVQLIGGARPRMALDYEHLLWDLIHLNGDEAQAAKVRVRWARDFKHRVYRQTSQKEAAATE
ncbi:type I-E CRISPR-associated protein Cse2/CasB [Nocardiopsis sediminis]|uniref:Type I-E CRISPR-associated protein Cse2/CasB n=1 Tax=Nocardiopsis sediminis TaxID=1778267 RepID=A0ABV8FS27_9ACTN